MTRTPSERPLLTRQFAAAHDAVGRALQIDPGHPQALGSLGDLELLEGNATGALTTYRQIADEPGLAGVAMVEHALGHTRQAQKALDELIAKHGQDSPYDIASVYAWRGERDKAFEWLERAYQRRDSGLPDLKLDPFLASVHSDPRFAAMLRKMKLPE